MKAETEMIWRKKTTVKSQNMCTTAKITTFILQKLTTVFVFIQNYNKYISHMYYTTNKAFGAQEKRRRLLTDKRD